jgi:polysaccharide biosynthesis protein PslJ
LTPIVSTAPDTPLPSRVRGVSALAAGAVRHHDGALFGWLLAGYPVSWMLGLGLFHHLVLAAAMVVWLAANGPLRIAPGTGYLALFVAVVIASAVGLQDIGSAAVYALRLSWYVAALVSWLYLARHRGAADGRRLVRALVWLWILVVVGGWVSVIAPELGWNTPLARILPGALADNDLVDRFLRPQVSETQVFRYQDVILHRPASPFAYTNGWGSAMALLTPFALAALHDRRIGFPRPAMVGLLVAALVPFTAALNRGAWLTLGAGLVYGTVRWAIRRGDARPVALLGLFVVAGLAVATLTGATESAVDALDTRSADSNETRSGLYVETLAEAARSPLIGYGSTRPSVTNPDGPPLGTHGQLWAVLYGHGYLGLALYVGFFLSAFRRARSIDPVQHWAKVSLLVGILQLPIYGHLPHQLFIMIGAAAIAGWSADPSSGRS